MNLRIVTVAAVMLLGLTLSPVRAEDAKGFFGLGVSVDGEGFFLNPTLRSIKVEKVEPKSPAANAGIAPGDRIIEVEGRVIAGTKARELEPLMRKKVGQPLHLLLKRPGGESFKVVLIAIAKPAGK